MYIHDYTHSLFLLDPHCYFYESTTMPQALAIQHDQHPSQKAPSAPCLPPSSYPTSHVTPSSRYPYATSHVTPGAPTHNISNLTTPPNPPLPSPLPPPLPYRSLHPSLTPSLPFTPPPKSHDSTPPSPSPSHHLKSPNPQPPLLPFSKPNIKKSQFLPSIHHSILPSRNTCHRNTLIHV